MKIGVYGGTFNPIHRGHVHILREFIKRLKLDSVIVMPAKKPPHKEADDLADDMVRAELCAAALRGIRGTPAQVSLLEIRRPGKSYTCRTLEQLHSLYPRDELYLLMGEDMFLTLETWRHPEIIFRLAAVCASPRSREGYESLLARKQELERDYGAVCFVEDIPWLEISSTEIRERAAAGKSLRGLVPKSVEARIKELGLYRKGEMR